MIINVNLNVPNGEKCCDSDIYCCGVVDMMSTCAVFNEHLEFYSKEDSYEPAKCKSCLEACGIIPSDKKEKKESIHRKLPKQKIKKEKSNPSQPPKKRGRPPKINK